jgi:CHAT domain-containing protein/tetratricopeptide (TPR) repeat protein
MRSGIKYIHIIKLVLILLLFFAPVNFLLEGQGDPRFSSEKAKQELRKLDDVRVLLKDRSYADAKALAQEILGEVEDKHGIDSPQAAQVIDVLVEAIVGMDKRIDEESQALIDRAITIHEQELGPNRSEVVKSLIKFSKLCQRAGDYEKAKELSEQALSKADKTYGSKHIEVARILQHLGSIHRYTRDWMKARDYLERALRIRETELGAEHLDVADTLTDLGLLLDEIGELVEAKSHHERALAIREKALGSDHESVAKSLQNLGLVLHTMGDYAEAKNLYERAIPILEKTLGSDHPGVASSLNDLGYLLKDMGNYKGAMRCHERALEIREKVFGDQHPMVAYSLNNLAVVLNNIGDYKRALPLLKRCLVICEKAFGPDNPNVAIPLNNISNALSAMGDSVQAEIYIRRAFEIQEKALGPDSVSLVPYIGNYAVELKRLGKFDEAKELLQRALMIQEKNLGPDHPELSLSLINLAEIHMNTGEVKNALALIERAQTITEKLAGPLHPLMSKILFDYSNYLWYAGEKARAFSKAMRAEEIGRNQMYLIAESGSERQTLAYATEKAYKNLDICLSLAVKLSGGTEGAVGEVWDAIVRTRGFVLDEMAMRNRTIVEIDDPEVAELVESLASARQHLADLVVRGPNPGNPEENFQSLIDEARNKKELAEQALARASFSFRKNWEEKRAGFSDVKSFLPHGFAMVAFVRYWHYALPQNGTDQDQDEPTPLHESIWGPSYLAFVLRAHDEEPVAILLGRSEDIEPLIFDWRQEVARGTRIPRRTVKDSELAYQSSGETLRQKVWDPLTPYIGDAKGVLVVPDGSLQAVNFAALPIGSERYMIESGPMIHYLSSEKDLFSTGGTIGSGMGLLAMGDSAFEATSLFAALAPEDKPKQSIFDKAKSLVSFRGVRSECGDFKSLKFGSLPATNDEIQEVTTIWKNSQKGEDDNFIKFTGSEASEEAFKMAAPGKRILHLATHGFFLEGNCQSVFPRFENSRGPPDDTSGDLPPVTEENPLLLTGLAFAGANHREVAGPEEDDGILTAEEVAALDLSGVDLVVLSACDTGAGKIQAVEGVFGLRRAFRIAGAKKLVTSLWTVEDEATRKWMKAFYEALLSKGLGAAESVRVASLEVLQERRKKNKSSHPFYWAGFVASGDWK